MLEVIGLRRRFGELVALDGVSFEVEAGELLGFLGPNGAGKTTTLRAIMGVTAPDAGEVRWNGRPTDEAARLRFGYMPEERGLYPKMRVLDQLVFLAELHGSSKQQARANALAWLERLGLADRARDRLQDLSHGNQQRVQLAAALVHDPDLLVLDEPFSGLDPVAVDLLAALLVDQAAQGRAVVFSSHQLDLVEGLCERVTILDRGRVVLAGSVHDLKRAAGTGRRLRIEVVGADEMWAHRLRGVRLLTTNGTTATMELRDGVDPAALLGEAQRAGTVEDFRLELPHLSDLFREAVGR